MCHRFLYLYGPPLSSSFAAHHILFPSVPSMQPAACFANNTIVTEGDLMSVARSESMPPCQSIRPDAEIQLHQFKIVLYDYITLNLILEQNRINYCRK